jgi:hypothetical protein
MALGVRPMLSEQDRNQPVDERWCAPEGSASSPGMRAILAAISALLCWPYRDPRTAFGRCSGRVRPIISRTIETRAQDERDRRLCFLEAPARRIRGVSCKKDDECGDGFCDRGRCAAIWTYGGQYGQPCEGNYGGLLCIDGRFRSCVSDAECAWTHDPRGPKCVSNTRVPGGRLCVYTIPSIIPSFP